MQKHCRLRLYASNLDPLLYTVLIYPPLGFSGQSLCRSRPMTLETVSLHPPLESFSLHELVVGAQLHQMPASRTRIWPRSTMGPQFVGKDQTRLMLHQPADIFVSFSGQMMGVSFGNIPAMDSRRRLLPGSDVLTDFDVVLDRFMEQYH